MKSQRIETIRKKFHNEWLLIKLDANRTSGRLIAHNPSRDLIFNKMTQFKNSGATICVEYSENKFPKGVVAAFVIYG